MTSLVSSEILPMAICCLILKIPLWGAIMIFVIYLICKLGCWMFYPSDSVKEPTHIEIKPIGPIIVEEIGYADGKGERIFSDGTVETYYRKRKNDKHTDIKQIENQIKVDDDFMFSVHENNLLIKNKKFYMTAKLENVKFGMESLHNQNMIQNATVDNNQIKEESESDKNEDDLLIDNIVESELSKEPNKEQIKPKRKNKKRGPK